MLFHLLPFILAFFYPSGSPAECLPSGIVFTSQSQVDDFPELYPGCDHIGGNVYINGPVFNLDSLKGLRFIGGSLVLFNTSLKNLSGLEDLQSVQGGLSIYFNTSLTSFSGLDSLKSAGLNLNIDHNDSLTHIGGLAGLIHPQNALLRLTYCPRLAVCDIPSLCQYIGSGGSALIHDNAPGCNSKFQIAKACNPGAICPSENIHIHGQEDLNDFVSLFPDCDEITGSLHLISVEDTFYSLLPLSGIRTVGQALIILNNSMLTDLTGLDSLRSVGNGLTIHSNARLKNLAGLGSLKKIGNIFQLVHNDSLVSLDGLGLFDPDSLFSIYFQFCGQLSACDHPSVCGFLSKGRIAFLEGNAPSCNNSYRIQKNCFPDSICPPGDLYFRSQNEINDFHVLFPNCHDLAGNLSIQGRNITSLDSLFDIKSVAGDFYLANNDSLERVSGLSGLQSIGLNFTILYNPALISLSGLVSLREIGAGLVVDYNSSLQDLGSLPDSLLLVHPDIYLRIFYNPLLAVCHAPAICAYLANSNNADIEGNAPGCTSRNEILLFCNPDPNCPPGNIEIRSQEDLNFFAQIYSACTHLPGSLSISSDQGPVTSLAPLGRIKSIGGTLNIENNPSLSNLYGLDSLEYIGGALSIGSNTGIESLEGLESLRIVKDYLAIYQNDALLRLEGLDNLILDSLSYLYVYDCPQLRECNLPNFCSYLIQAGKAVIRDNAPGCNNPFEVVKSCQPGESCPPGLQKIYNQRQLDEWVAAFPDCTELPGSLQIGPAEEADPILSLSGLSKLRKIGGSLEINQNPWLKSLQGLDSLQRVGADLRIYSMDSLETLLPLMSLDLIGGQLYLRNNRSLTALDGLDQFDADSLDALFIWFNEQLALCSNTAICTYLATGKSAAVSDNAAGCSSTMAVRLGCGVFCSQNSFDFFSQEEIDAFPANNPGCQNIDGYIYISGSDITNLDSLKQIRAIGGDLDIGFNPILTNLDGLSALQSIGGYLWIYSNNLLDNIGSLSQIRSIGGDLDISSNPILTNLDGLSALQSIGGYLGVYSNNLLDNIDALSQIDNSGITKLYIQANPRLAVCNTPVICAFLNDETKAPYAYVNDNKPGCNNTSEIKTACGLANCPEGNLTLHTQAEVDSFRITYGDCAVLPGDLVINGLDITSLDSLSNLYIIGGQLIIENTSLENLQGLDHILYNTISHLVIRDNPTLSVCDVRAVCDYLSLSGNPSEISGNAEGCGTESEVRLSCSRTCFWDGVSFTSQAQVDSFRALYGNCELIPHAVTISGSGISRLDSFFNLKKIGRSLIILSTSVPDLDGLAALDSVGGSLDIRSNSQLADISQLQNIRSIGSTLRIQSNSKLTTLDGLGGISGVPFNLTIQSNSTLTSLSGLDSIRYVGNNLLVFSNSKLNSFSGLRSLNTVGFDCRLESNALVINLQGLEKLESVGNDLRILNNAGLRTAAGLSGLVNIGRHLRIENNAGLDSLSGFSVLETIGGNFQLINNDNLKKIHSLSGLRQIGQSLIIRNNDLLPSLNGLDQIEPESLEYLSIENNALLDLCNVRSVCLYLLDPVNPYSIFGNGASCQTADQILSSCSIALPVSLISFNASLDGEAALLQWETSPDLNPDFFILEHSRDGDRFNPLEKVYGRQETNLFTYRHAAPPGMNYYRLKLVFEVGKPVYSKTAGIRIKEEIRVLPNPTRGPLQIKVPDDKNSRIEVMDLTGRVVLYTTGRGLQEIDLSGQAAGLYLISVLSSSGHHIFKIQKE